MSQSRVRPLARGIWVGLVSLALVISGVLSGTKAVVALGVVVLVGVLADALMLGLFGLHSPGRLRRTVTPNPCFAGQSVTVDIGVAGKARRRDWGALSVRLDDGLPEGSGSIDLGLSPTYQVVPYWRGQWWLGPATMRVVSPLGGWRQTATDDAKTSLIAWPEVAPLTEDPGRASDPEDLLTGRVGPRVARPDDMILRAYEPGDDLRRIHWLHSARLGTLLTRTEEPLESRHAWLGLWFAPGSAPEAHELAISLAASCCLTWSQSGFVVDAGVGATRLPQTLDEQLTALALLDAALDHGGLADLPPPLRLDGPAVLVVAVPQALPEESSTPNPRVWDGLPPARPAWLRGAPSRLARLAVSVGGDQTEAPSALTDLGWSALVLAEHATLEAAATQVGNALEAASGRRDR